MRPSPDFSPGGDLTRRGLVLTALALAGCASVRSAAPGPVSKLPSVSFAAEPLEELEPVLAITPGPYDVTVRMASNGCTTKPDIAVYVERKGDAARLAFARRRLDLCGAKGGTVELRFGWAELALPPGTPIVLLNPQARPAEDRTAPPGAR